VIPVSPDGYVIEAAGAGGVQTQAIDVNAAVVPLHFNLP